LIYIFKYGMFLEVKLIKHLVGLMVIVQGIIMFLLCRAKEASAVSKQYYYHNGREQKGPFSFEDLKMQARDGAFSSANLVWADHMPKWVEASEVEGLFTPASTPPPPPFGGANPPPPAPVPPAPPPAPPFQPVRKPAANTAGQNDYRFDGMMLSQLSSWIGFVGIMMIIGGVISAISGLFAFVIGAIPGIITLILGLKLRTAKKHADAMLADHSTSLSSANFGMFVDSLRSFFKIMGILIIIALVLSLLGIIFGVVASFMMPNIIENLTNLLG
jgi:hypothetical protein